MEQFPSSEGGTPTQRARRLRREASDAENILWLHLKNRQLAAAKFVRQKTFGDYILDFYCHQAFLVVEIDGSQHSEPAQAVYDARRTQHLERQGLRVLRSNNLEVLQQTDAVLGRILEALDPSD